MTLAIKDKCRFPPCEKKRYNTQEFCYKHEDVIAFFLWFIKEMEKISEESKTESGLVIPEA